jgi:hypothetical protein
VLTIRSIAATGAAAQRYRFVVTDGTDSNQSMPATQLNELVLDGSIKENSLIKLTKYTTNMVSNVV